MISSPKPRSLVPTLRKTGEELLNTFKTLIGLLSTWVTAKLLFSEISKEEVAERAKAELDEPTVSSEFQDFST